jgi:hypothetical protein
LATFLSGVGETTTSGFQTSRPWLSVFTKEGVKSTNAWRAAAMSARDISYRTSGNPSV